MLPMCYVAGPYTTPDPITNVRRAVRVGTMLLDTGLVAPIVPHLTMLWDLLTPRPYEEWLAYDREVLTRCDALLRISGDSSGADEEVLIAKEHGIPVFVHEHDLLQWAMTEWEPKA